MSTLMLYDDDPVALVVIMDDDVPMERVALPARGGTSAAGRVVGAPAAEPAIARAHTRDCAAATDGRQSVGVARSASVLLLRAHDQACQAKPSQARALSLRPPL